MLLVASADRSVKHKICVELLGSLKPIIFPDWFPWVVCGQAPYEGCSSLRVPLAMEKGVPPFVFPLTDARFSILERCTLPDPKQRPMLAEIITTLDSLLYLEPGSESPAGLFNDQDRSGAALELLPSLVSYPSSLYANRLGRRLVLSEISSSSESEISENFGYSMISGVPTEKMIGKLLSLGWCSFDNGRIPTLKLRSQYENFIRSPRPQPFMDLANSILACTESMFRFQAVRKSSQIRGYVIPILNITPRC